MIQIAGAIYAGLALIVVLFQFALALGAPWGHLAMGGRWPGQFSPLLRVSAVVQGGIMAFLGHTVAGHAGLFAPVTPRWMLWVVVGVTALSFAGNVATSSRPERVLWGPVAFVMLVASVVVLIGSQAL